MTTPLDDEDLRLAIFHAFARDGRAPEIAALARLFGVDPGRIRTGLGRLAESRHLALDADHNIVMAHPFSAVPLMDLPTLWRLAEHWYDGRLGRGYQRREPSASSDYLNHVGLTGPFWGH